MPFIIYCSCYPQVCYPKLLDKMRCNCEISYQGISSVEKNYLQIGGIVLNTFQDENRFLILNVFSSCITLCTFLYIKIRAKFCFVPIEWRRSLFDGGLREVGCNVQGIKRAAGIKKCTEKCAWMHSFLCITLLVHGF